MKFVNTTNDEIDHYTPYILDTLCDIVCQRLTTGFFSGTPVSSANKTDRNDISEILLKVELNTIDQTKPLMLYYHGDVIIINGTQKTYGKLFMTTIVVPYFHFSG